MSAAHSKPIGIEAYGCLTALGDAQESCRRLRAGEIALQPRAVLGEQGGDLVPLALRDASCDETLPPRWLNPLESLVGQVPQQAWGTEGFPVFVSSSNFDVGSLYSYRAKGDDERFLKLGTPARTVDYLASRFGWGKNVVVLSHACVTAHLALEMASRYLAAGAAKKALVVSFDFVSPFVAGGFHSLKILNGEFPAPFQDREVGAIGLGDGAAFAVLTPEAAPARIESNFLYNEMYHFTANDPSGAGFSEVGEWMKATAQGRKVWVKGHGTGTLDSGRMEAEAAFAALPESPLVSWKGSLGHTLGSCGLVELAIALEAMRCGEAPGSPNVSDPVFSANVQKESFSLSDYNGAILLSNAFGGAHAGCLVSHD